MIQFDDHIFQREKPPTRYALLFATNLKMMFLFCHDLLVSWTLPLIQMDQIISFLEARL